MIRYLGSARAEGAEEAKCVEEEIELGAEAEELGERGRGIFWRGLDDGGPGSGICFLLFVGDLCGLSEREPLLLHSVETRLLLRYRGCGRHGGRREQVEMLVGGLGGYIGERAPAAKIRENSRKRVRASSIYFYYSPWDFRRAPSRRISVSSQRDPRSSDHGTCPHESSSRALDRCVIPSASFHHRRSASLARRGRVRRLNAGPAAED